MNAREHREHAEKILAELARQVEQATTNTIGQTLDFSRYSLGAAQVHAALAAVPDATEVRDAMVPVGAALVLIRNRLRHMSAGPFDVTPVVVARGVRQLANVVEDLVDVVEQLEQRAAVSS